MFVTVLGTQVIAYTSKKTGLPVSGVSLHCCFKDNNVFGEAVDSIFVSDNLGIRKMVETIQPGTQVDLQTNFRGSVVGVVPFTGSPSSPDKQPTK